MFSSAVLKYNFEQLQISIFILYDFIEPVDAFMYNYFWVHHALLFCENHRQFEKKKMLDKGSEKHHGFLNKYMFWLK